VADSTSGDRAANSGNGRSKRTPASDGPGGERTTADSDQTLSEADQTASDSDQTLSDVEQTSADSDQASADSDQAAADHDQAASDQDLAAGADPTEHDVSQAIRRRSANERERSAGQRDLSARMRLRAGEQRDAIADARDVAAQARDLSADARDLAMAQAGVLDGHADGARAPNGADSAVPAEDQRGRVAQQRAKAAEYRVRAAEDRLMAERDRDDAARERRRSLVDRELCAAELERVHELRHHAEQLAGTLQKSLSPRSLPVITGLDVAVHYEPAATENVGGDFYDLFSLAEGRTGFFLGDVCGKGPEAAAVTSLARYTMRTAAMLRELPAAILADLNAALMTHTDGPTTTCTAVYGQLDMSTEAATVTLAVAGHPPPLIVRRDGSVITTGAHGTMLGAVVGPVFHTRAIDLGPGDTIVVYSDGILDTHIDGIRIDTQHVAELLAGPPARSAQDIADRLTRALQDVERPLHDDVAIMTLRRTPSQ